MTDRVAVRRRASGGWPAAWACSAGDKKTGMAALGLNWPPAAPAAAAAAAAPAVVEAKAAPPQQQRSKAKKGFGKK